MSFRYWKYELPGGTTFYLTVRPDSYPEETAAWVAAAKPQVRFSFTDGLVGFDGVEHHWYPWIPGKHLRPEFVYAALELMHHMMSSGTKTFWLHCDSSSMRAPTFFGLFLMTRFPDDVKTICDAVAAHSPRDNCSRPDDYASTSLLRDLGIRELVEAWRRGGPNAAYVEIMRLKGE
jgi:hypothetical protein